MAIYTKISKKDVVSIERKFNLGKIIFFKGIKKGIENTNYLIKTKNKKYILTIFEKRVQKKDLPFFMSLMDKLNNHNINCPKPQKSKTGSYLFNIKNKPASIVSFVEGKDKNKLKINDCYEIGRNVAKLHIASKKIKLYRKNSMSLNSWPKLLNKIGNRCKKIDVNLNDLMKASLKDIKKKWPKKLSSGIIHFNLTSFVLICIVTRGLRFFLVAYLTYKFGSKFGPFLEKKGGQWATIITVIIIVIAAGIYFHIF